MSEPNADLWTYRDGTGHRHNLDLIDYTVEATDGEVGTVKEMANEANTAHLLVDTGKWIFGRTVLVPAGIVVRIDAEERKVLVDRSKSEIKHSPEFHPDKHRGDAGYRQELGGYYSPLLPFAVPNVDYPPGTPGVPGAGGPMPGLVQPGAIEPDPPENDPERRQDFPR
jgi:hypothetical protein